MRSKFHHTNAAERIPLHEAGMKPISYEMAFVHGLIAGFGFGTYATIITFVLAPQMPGILFAPLPGLMFGLGTMVMQVIFGSFFATFIRMRRLKEDDLCYLGRYTAGKTLYYGSLLFVLTGLSVSFLPSFSETGFSTGIPLLNLSKIDLGTALLVGVVGILGIGSLIKAFGIVRKINSSDYCAK